MWWRCPERRYRGARQQQQQHLWQFLLETLSNPNYNPCYIEWLDRAQGIFRFVESQKIARLWGLRRRRANMSYEYFSRAMRSVHSLIILLTFTRSQAAYTPYNLRLYRPAWRRNRLYSRLKFIGCTRRERLVVELDESDVLNSNNQPVRQLVASCIHPSSMAY